MESIKCVLIRDFWGYNSDCKDKTATQGLVLIRAISDKSSNIMLFQCNKKLLDITEQRNLITSPFLTFTVNGTFGGSLMFRNKPTPVFHHNHTISVKKCDLICKGDIRQCLQEATDFSKQTIYRETECLPRVMTGCNEISNIKHLGIRHVLFRWVRYCFKTADFYRLLPFFAPHRLARLTWEQLSWLWGVLQQSPILFCVPMVAQNLGKHMMEQLGAGWFRYISWHQLDLKWFGATEEEVSVAERKSVSLFECLYKKTFFSRDTVFEIEETEDNLLALRSLESHCLISCGYVKDDSGNRKHKENTLVAKYVFVSECERNIFQFLDSPHIVVEIYHCEVLGNRGSGILRIACAYNNVICFSSNAESCQDFEQQTGLEASNMSHIEPVTKQSICECVILDCVHWMGVSEFANFCEQLKGILGKSNSVTKVVLIGDACKSSGVNFGGFGNIFQDLWSSYRFYNKIDYFPCSGTEAFELELKMGDEIQKSDLVISFGDMGTETGTIVESKPLMRIVQQYLNYAKCNRLHSQVMCGSMKSVNRLQKLIYQLEHKGALVNNSFKCGDQIYIEDTQQHCVIVGCFRGSEKITNSSTAISVEDCGWIDVNPAGTWIDHTICCHKGPNRILLSNHKIRHSSVIWNSHFQRLKLYSGLIIIDQFMDYSNIINFGKSCESRLFVFAHNRDLLWKALNNKCRKPLTNISLFVK